MEKHNTTAGEEELIRALAGGASEQQAAERAGVEKAAVRLRRTDAEFRYAVHEARDLLFDSAWGQIAGLAGVAVETLERLMRSDKPSVALGAAKAVIELGPRLRRATEIDERINRLEEDPYEESEESEEIAGKQTIAGEEELAQALAAGASEREAAERAGIEEAAVRLRRADPDFRRAVSRARGWMLEAALGRLASLAGVAAEVLERLMESDQPSVARGAAKAVLVLAPRLRETELDERITRLEEEAARRPEKRHVFIESGWYGDA